MHEIAGAQGRRWRYGRSWTNPAPVGACAVALLSPQEGSGWRGTTTVPEDTVLRTSPKDIVFHTRLPSRIAILGRRCGWGPPSLARAAPPGLLSSRNLTGLARANIGEATPEMVGTWRGRHHSSRSLREQNGMKYFVPPVLRYDFLSFISIALFLTVMVNRSVCNGRE